MSRGLKGRSTGDDEVKATPDAYTGMLAISLVALIGAAVFLYLDYSKYPSGKPPTAPIPGTEFAPPVQPGQNPGIPNPGVPNPGQNPGGQNPGQNPGQDPGGQNPGQNPPGQQGVLLPPEIQ